MLLEFPMSAVIPLTQLDAVNLMLAMDVKGLLPGHMLTKVDRMSMVNALEVRVPFLDHKVAFPLPGDWIPRVSAMGEAAIALREAKDVHQASLRAAELAVEAAGEASTPEKPRFVAGSIGPTTKAISVTGGITFEERSA